MYFYKGEHNDHTIKMDSDLRQFEKGENHNKRFHSRL